MLNESDLLEAVRIWASGRVVNFRDDGVELEINESPEDRDPRSIQLIFETPEKLSEIIVWGDGNAELSFADVQSGEIVPEHRDIRSGPDLEDALRVTVEWVKG